MRTISFTERILNRIENVRDWLDRAEEGYRSDEHLQGEMNLNLAQAELKKAWEESRNHTGQQGQVIPFPPTPEEPPVSRSRYKGLRLHSPHRYALVAAVVLLLLINVTPLMQIFRGNEPAVPHGQDISAELTLKEPDPGVPETAEAVGVETRTEKISPAVSVESRPVVQKPVSRAVSSGTDIHFDVKPDQLVYTPVKEVKPEPVSTVQAEVQYEKTFALQSRSLSTGGKSTDKWPLYTAPTAKNVSTAAVLSQSGVSTGPEAGTTVNRERTVVKYDVDQLVDLAKATLTSKR